MISAGINIHTKKYMNLDIIFSFYNVFIFEIIVPLNNHKVNKFVISFYFNFITSRKDLEANAYVLHI